MMDLPSKERVSAVLSYDPETGILTWKITSGNARTGRRAGASSGRYRCIGIDGHLYPEHRIAWLLAHGKWPTHEIDHINRDGHDNRLANLRDVTASENNRNRRLQSNNTHGVPGVYFNAKAGTWYAQACHGGKNKHLGTFATFEAAAAARRQFQEDNGYHSNHGRPQASDGGVAQATQGEKRAA